MLISETLSEAFNAQAGRELGASNQYINIATFFDVESLPELAAFFYRQSDEERMHALKFVHYVAEAGGEVALPTVPAPSGGIKTAEEAVKRALDWELEVTQQINSLMDQAIKENDHIAQDFLRWFVTEQLEEVSSMDQLLSVIRRAGQNGLLMVEQYLARAGAPAASPGAE
ncbi:MAG TPA: ferritin [Anaerolineales bacterium]|nr:ferritin [Anaerolineales bacterium]